MPFCYTFPCPHQSARFVENSVSLVSTRAGDVGQEGGTILLLHPIQI